MRSDEDLSKLVNQSGFPLQMAIDRLVSDSFKQHGWKVVYRENAWTGPDGNVGFVDLVLQDQLGAYELVVECKRVLDSDWVFLEELPAGSLSQRTRLLVTKTAGNGSKAHSGYCDVAAKPESKESMYCVVSGQDNKSKPMLERVAAEVLAAMEAIAIEEKPIIAKCVNNHRSYIPVIVTTARLIVSQLDPKLVALKNGEASVIAHQVQPWIRFRKQYSPEYAVKPKSPEYDISALADAKEKVVFVVNVESFLEFLIKWKIQEGYLDALF